MRSIKQAGLIATLVLALAAAPAALASGGSGGGGGGTGGGGSGGGGGNSGGVKDVTAPPPVPCASIVSVSAPVGYYSVYAALWNTFTIKSCATGGNQTYNVRVRNTDVATGRVDYDITIPYTLTGGQNIGSVLDNDFAPFDTTYSIDISVSDVSGNVLASGSTTATTPSQR